MQSRKIKMVGQHPLVKALNRVMENISDRLKMMSPPSPPANQQPHVTPHVTIEQTEKTITLVQQTVQVLTLTHAETKENNTTVAIADDAKKETISQSIRVDEQHTSIIGVDTLQAEEKTLSPITNADPISSLSVAELTTILESMRGYRDKVEKSNGNRKKVSEKLGNTLKLFFPGIVEAYIQELIMLYEAHPDKPKLFNIIIDEIDNSPLSYNHKVLQKKDFDLTKLTAGIKELIATKLRNNETLTNDYADTCEFFAAVGAMHPHFYYANKRKLGNNPGGLLLTFANSYENLEHQAQEEQKPARAQKALELKTQANTLREVYTSPLKSGALLRRFTPAFFSKALEVIEEETSTLEQASIDIPQTKKRALMALTTHYIGAMNSPIWGPWLVTKTDEDINNAFTFFHIAGQFNNIIQSPATFAPASAKTPLSQYRNLLVSIDWKLRNHFDGHPRLIAFQALFALAQQHITEHRNPTWDFIFGKKTTSTFQEVSRHIRRYALDALMHEVNNTEKLPDKIALLESAKKMTVFSMHRFNCIHIRCPAAIKEIDDKIKLIQDALNGHFNMFDPIRMGKSPYLTTNV